MDRGLKTFEGSPRRRLTPSPVSYDRLTSLQLEVQSTAYVSPPYAPEPQFEADPSNSKDLNSLLPLRWTSLSSTSSYRDWPASRPTAEPCRSSAIWPACRLCFARECPLCRPR